MAGYTTHYNLIKPTSAERVAVGDINDNSDIIDGNLFTANERANQMADDYNASETYNTGDYVRRENYLYKCNTDNTTGTWDATKWDRVKVMDEITQGGGGGSSTLAGLNDVNISSPTDGQALIYDDITGKWVNGAGGGGSSTLAGLSDVSVAGVANKDVIRYNSTSQKYEKSSALTDLELAVSQISASTLGITNGHEILAPDGTAMAQEDDLQFVGSNVTDDDTNGKTVVTTNIDIEQADYDVLVANDADLPGVNYNITDAQPVAVNASNLPYSSTQSTKQKIDEKVGDFIFLTETSAANPGIAIPQGAKELYIKVKSEVASSTYLSFVFNILTDSLSSTREYIGNGYYRTQTDFAHCTTYIDKTTIAVISLSYCGSNKSTTARIYYR